jgi:hypothetical protein
MEFARVRAEASDYHITMGAAAALRAGTYRAKSFAEGELMAGVAAQDRRSAMQSRVRLLALLLVAVVLAAAVDARNTARAQSYCAMFSDGSKSCGLPSLQSCQQTVSGVGGYCTPDLSSQLGPDLFDRHRLFRSLQDPLAPDQGGPPGGDVMPPPPDSD